MTLEGVKIRFTQDAFSFLKLHGSVAAWTQDYLQSGHPHHQQCILQPPASAEQIDINDNLFFARSPDGTTPGPLRKPPLLYFPSHRQAILSGQTGFPFHRYAQGVWERAQDVIERATGIHVIGYSFSGIDRGPMLELLDRAIKCRQILIQGPQAANICRKLLLSRPKLENLVKTVESPF